MRFARKSELLRPSGRLLESRSDPGPRGMIIALREPTFWRKLGLRARGGQNPAYRLTRRIFYFWNLR